MSHDAICAIATPAGSSALGIIRVSGKDLTSFIKKVFSIDLENRKATLLNIKDGKNVIDKSIVIYYASPHSFTGEDMLEIICHGNQIIMNSIVDLLLEKGAKNACPGEFSQRAFFNNKIDLTQAEAIADLVSASDERAVKAAQNSLSGKFAQEIEDILENILIIRSEVESIINFPEDDDVPMLNIEKIKNKIEDAYTSLSNIINNSYEGINLSQRKKYAFVGKPNSGKSSLINCLLRKDASIVSHHAGTTRDAIEYELRINNKIVNIIDTAGLRDAVDDIEREGISRAIKSITNADRLFYVIDDTKGISEADKIFMAKLQINKFTFLFNKIDLTEKDPMIEKNDNDYVYVSAKKNLGIDLIKQTIMNDFLTDDVNENIYLARSRHVELLRQGLEHLSMSKDKLLEDNFDLSAEELRLSHLALSSILGQNPTEDLLNKIFSSFCIGK